MSTADLPFGAWAATGEGRAVITAALAYRDRPADPEAPFIVSRFTPRDKGKRGLASGTIIARRPRAHRDENSAVIVSALIAGRMRRLLTVKEAS